MRLSSARQPLALVSGFVCLPCTLRTTAYNALTSYTHAGQRRQLHQPHIDTSLADDLSEQLDSQEIVRREVDPKPNRRSKETADHLEDAVVTAGTGEAPIKNGRALLSVAKKAALRDEGKKRKDNDLPNEDLEITESRSAEKIATTKGKKTTKSEVSEVRREDARISRPANREGPSIADALKHLQEKHTSQVISSITPEITKKRGRKHTVTRDDPNVDNEIPTKFAGAIMANKPDCNTKQEDIGMKQAQKPLKEGGGKARPKKATKSTKSDLKISEGRNSTSSSPAAIEIKRVRSQNRSPSVTLRAARSKPRIVRVPSSAPATNVLLKSKRSLLLSKSAPPRNQEEAISQALIEIREIRELLKNKGPSEPRENAIRRHLGETAEAAAATALPNAILEPPPASRMRKTGPKKPATTQPKKSDEGLPQVADVPVETINTVGLEMVPVDSDMPPVPTLAYGLERVLFNPGVYQLQDPRSCVYNFDPYLQEIMPVAEFDFNALKEYITSSRDVALEATAKREGKKYSGSTSSMTSTLTHFHYLLSQWREINPDMLSASFPVEFKSFTSLQRAPSAIFLRWQNGTYAIDADKEFDSPNILSMLGKSMEKMLTLPKDEFERYRKSNPEEVSEEEREAPEAYHYSTMGDFLMRSQLDAYDPRLPGSGMFDLKTRAVLSIRMNVEDYKNMRGYEITNRLGGYESYEREYFDMIRSAFLKYSSQVRMGRMDGIFVAFHNTQRIFGFQYISINEMDLAVHGQYDRSLGDQEFKLSLQLLNKALDKATERFPGQTIRLHFDTRDTKVPFMYIFAEPVTDDEMDQIQSRGKAKILAFEREALGLRKASEDETDVQENWDVIRAQVDELIEEDEADEDELANAIKIPDEDTIDFHKTDIVEPDEQGANKVRTGKTLGTSQEDTHEEPDVGEYSTAQHSSTDAIASLSLNEEAGSSSTNSPISDLDNTLKTETTTEVGSTEAPVDSQVAEDAEGESSQDQPDHMTQEDTSTVHMDIAIEARDTSEVPALDSSSYSLEDMEAHSLDSLQDALAGGKKDKEADGTFLDELEQVHEKNRSAGPLLAMTLTIRNKVNGKFVTRPEKINNKTDWEVEYVMAEMTDSARAWRLYQMCSTRRKKAYSQESGQARYKQPFMSELRDLAKSREKVRKEQNEVGKDDVKVVFDPANPSKVEMRAPTARDLPEE